MTFPRLDPAGHRELNQISIAEIYRADIRRRKGINSDVRLLAIHNRCSCLSFDELMRGYYLGLNPRPDDETAWINCWNDFE